MVRVRAGAPSMMTSPVTSRRIFNNFRVETDRAQSGRFGPTRKGSDYRHSLNSLLLPARPDLREFLKLSIVVTLSMFTKDWLVSHKFIPEDILRT